MSITAPGYTVDVNEEGHYHIEIEQPTWRQGKKLSAPFIFKCSRNDLRQFFMERERLGYTEWRIMHDPDPEYTKAVIAGVQALNGKVTTKDMREISKG